MLITRRRSTTAALSGLLALLAVAGAGTQAASAADARDGTFTCQATTKYGAFAPVSAGPNTYIIGNCAAGAQLRRTYYSPVRGGYYGGLIGGSFSGCGAVQRRNVSTVNRTEHTSVCRHAGVRPPSEFLWRVDCRSGRDQPCRAWDPTLAGDTKTRVVAPCQAYANYRPFNQTPAPTDPVQVITPANRPEAQVRWRYITKDRRFVMVHDTGWKASPGGTPWVFVPAGCVTTPHATTP